MEQLTLTNKLRGMGKEFFLQTSADPQKGTGTSILFEGGNPLDIIEFKITDDGRPPEAIVEEFHRNRLDKFNRLSDLYAELSNETDPSILEKLALSLVDQKLYREAAAILERTLVDSSQNSRLWNHLGLINLELHDYEKAADNFGRAIQLNPDYPDYYHNLGRADLKLGRCLSAYRNFEKAIELNVYFGEAYYNMALAVILNGIKREDYTLAQNLEDRATSLLAKAVGFNPLFKNDYLQRGIDALSNRDLPQAYSLISNGYDIACENKFPKKTYYFHLDYLFRHDLLKEDAVVRHIKRLQKMIEKYPNFPDLYNDLGLAYTVLAQYHSDRAIEAYERALKINPNYRTAIKNLKLTQNELKGLKTLLRAILK